MGRAGIRRRKKKRTRSGSNQDSNSGIIADLQDQAEWSSYTQDVPRLGNPYRESLRLARIRRTAGNLLGGGSLRGDWWVAIFVTCGLALAVFGVILGVAQFLRWVR